MSIPTNYPITINSGTLNNVVGTTISFNTIPFNSVNSIPTNITVNSGGGFIWTINNSQQITSTTVIVGDDDEEEIPDTKPSDGRDGLDCSSCGDFYQFAVANKNDGTLVCYKCRNGF